MWQWSIQASGGKDETLAILKSLNCPLNENGKPMDDDTISKYNEARDLAMEQINKFPDECYIEVGISGNAKFYSPVITYEER